MADKAINPTPFIINTVNPGSRDAVKALVATAKQNGMDGKPEGADQSLIEVAKTAIPAVLDLLPEEFNAAVVRSDGRFTKSGIQLVINIDGYKTL
jgi:hypothetical protein